MRKAIKIFLAVFLAICLAIGWLIYANWNSIEAFILSMHTTEEDTLKELEENKKQLEEFLESEENITVRDLTEDEEKALSEGTLSEEDLIKILTEPAPEPVGTPEPAKPPAKEPDQAETKTPTQTTSPPLTTTTPTPTSIPTQSSVLTATAEPTPSPSPSPEKRVSELIAKLYVQKSTYLGKLDEIEAQVRAEFIASPDKWGTLQDAKKVFLSKYLPTVANWEKTCDDMVYGVLDEIRTELKKLGKDDSIVETMKTSYLEEKKLKKTYFINRYMD